MGGDRYVRMLVRSHTTANCFMYFFKLPGGTSFLALIFLVHFQANLNRFSTPVSVDTDLGNVFIQKLTLSRQNYRKVQEKTHTSSAISRPYFVIIEQEVSSRVSASYHFSSGSYLDVIAAKLRDDGDLACFVVSFSGRTVYKGNIFSSSYSFYNQMC